MKPLRNEDQAPGWLLQSPRRFAVVVFILVGAVSLLGVLGIEKAETLRRRAALERNTADIAAVLRQLDTEHEIYLRASAALFASHDRVTAEDFRQLQSQLNFDRYRQGSLGVGWAPHVAAGTWQQAQAALPAGTSTTFRVRQVPANNGRPDHRDAFPILYIDPATPENAATIGFDVYSEPVRRAAMDEAAAIEAPVATGPIDLLQDARGARQAGFLIYMPVFGRPIAAPASDTRSLRSLRGYVFMPFRAPDLLALANRLSVHDKVGVAVYDGPSVSGPPMAWLGDRAVAGPELVDQIMIANRPWQLVVSGEPRDGLSRLSQLTILSGLIVALLLAALIRMTYQKINEERRLLEWRASESGIRNSLTRELNHRVKNTLATVLSIITITRRRETDLDSYVASLSGRIRALSATHDLLTSSDWANIELRQIVVAELAPYIGADEDQVSRDGHVTLDGPDIRLAPNDSLTLGLAVHELATNAAKFGGLSVLTGHVAIRWEKLSDHSVEIHWQETGGPAVSEPSKRGFGRELIEKILARELDSPVKLDFAPGGLCCVFRVPLRKPAPFVLRTDPDLPVSAKRA